MGDYYKREIIKMLEEIENDDILEYIYKMTVDIAREDKKNDIKSR